MTLDQRYIMMIDNAYYAVNPPVTEQRSQGNKFCKMESNLLHFIGKIYFRRNPGKQS